MKMKEIIIPNNYVDVVGDNCNYDFGGSQLDVVYLKKKPKIKTKSSH